MQPANYLPGSKGPTAQSIKGFIHVMIFWLLIQRGKKEGKRKKCLEGMRYPLIYLSFPNISFLCHCREQHPAYSSSYYNILSFTKWFKNSTIIWDFTKKKELETKVQYIYQSQLNFEKNGKFWTLTKVRYIWWVCSIQGNVHVITV